jgi:hypothetical protein
LESLFDVALDTAATTTGFRYHGALEQDLLRNLRTVVPIKAKCADKTDAQPLKWWQTVGIDELPMTSDMQV